MNAMALVFLGGGLGASLRYVAVHALFAMGGIGAAWAIMAVNILGSLLMGMALALVERGALSFGTTQTQLLIMTGLLGGFTTFSAFSADVLKMLQNGHHGMAAMYILGSVVLSLLAIAAGYYLVIGKNL